MLGIITWVLTELGYSRCHKEDVNTSYLSTKEGSGLGSMQDYQCTILLRRAKAVFANVIAAILVSAGVEMEKYERLKQLG